MVVKSIYTKVPYYSIEEAAELTQWMLSNVGKFYVDWDRYQYGKYTEIVVWDNDKASMVALRWA